VSGWSHGNTFKSFTALCHGLTLDLKGRRCVLDGEIVCLDPHGKPQFRDLLFRRAEPLFYAFDILWDEHARSYDEYENRRFHKGEDLRYLPLIDRKLRLHGVVPKRGERLLYCDHIGGDGEGLFQLACEHDLEGIVAKRKSDPYLPEHARWLKIRNQAYSQWVGREELFERERERDPDFQVWDGCVAACEAETGRNEVYVAPFPRTGAKWQVSQNGGLLPRWRRDGAELLFLGFNSGQFMAAEVNGRGANFEVGEVRELFTMDNMSPSIASGQYDVSADGKRFLVITTGEAGTLPLTLVQNWRAELKR
jgi:ATP dependent DNA ligase domain